MNDVKIPVDITETHGGVTVAYRAEHQDTGGTALPPRRASRPRRRRRWFRWLGFPSRADAAQHVRMIARHLLSLIGFRA